MRNYDLADQLVEFGLAEKLPYGYLRLQPTLGPALLGQLNDQEREAAHSDWAEAMEELAEFLYQQRRVNPRLSATLTLLELPNLLAVLEHLRLTASADRVVQLATLIEHLERYLGRPRAVTQAEKVRDAAMEQVGEWSDTRFLAESATIDRLLDAGRYPEAVRAAQVLLSRAEAAGENAYDGASYDLAMCHALLGRCLSWCGKAEAALAPLAEARKRFQRLADTGNASADRMVSWTITERADCLRNLGRLDEAAQTYEDAMVKDKELKDPRGVAAGSAALGTVRILQGKYDEALARLTVARKIAEDLGEPGNVAGSWNRIGMIHEGRSVRGRRTGVSGSAENPSSDGLPFGGSFDTERTREPLYQDRSVGGCRGVLQEGG